MLALYSLLYSLAMLLMSPLFLLRREKYASGFSERLGNYPEFKHDGRKVIWLHCVSVGETNAARPLVDELIKQFPNHRLVISTTTKTGQELAKKIFAGKADTVFYFPFDWKFAVRRALNNFRPSLILLMETEIWPRLIYEAKRAGANVAMVNGRLSERSFRRYSKVLGFVGRTLGQVDLALMQGEKDAERIRALGIDVSKTHVTGNIKFDLSTAPADAALTEYFRSRFGIDGKKTLIVAASTHEPEEKLIIDSLSDAIGEKVQLVIVPRHPERFDAVAKLLSNSGRPFVRRSANGSDSDRSADIILIDSIGELRAMYPLADIVFVGGSLVPHGGQSVLEPAAAGKAMITGAFTHNFADAVRLLLREQALIQIADSSSVDQLAGAFSELLNDPERRNELGRNALAVIENNRGAAARTIELLSGITGNW
jgi:3-deoxy-D-manno-octulosonic-acid transferase